MKIWKMDGSSGRTQPKPKEILGNVFVRKPGTVTDEALSEDTKQS